MLKENVPFDSLTTAGAMAPPQFHFPHCNPLSPSYVNIAASVYHSPNSPSESSSFDGGDVEHRLYDASCVLEYQQLYNLYTLCVSRLHDSIEEIDTLRRDNDVLRRENEDLSQGFSLLLSRDRLLSDLNRINISAPHAATPRHACAAAAPQPLAEHNREEPRNIERVTLPKCISVRSSGYLKMNRPGRESNRQKPVSQPGFPSQRVCIPGVKKEEEALEFEVYNQGMIKTELCNKWQETGTCPYGDNCQFAHGLKELRPVIRHPRYKTEVCRMVLAGEICPYGHRCHFRHAVTEEERLMATPPPPH